MSAGTKHIVWLQKSKNKCFFVPFLLSQATRKQSTGSKSIILAFISADSKPRHFKPLQYSPPGHQKKEHLINT